MIKVCYNNIQSKININGLLFDHFIIMEGVHQGCHLPMLLYIIAAEVLVNFVIADKRVKGVQIGSQEIKIVNFADDTTILLRDIDCLNRIQTILDLYEKAYKRLIFLKVKPYGQVFIKTDMINQEIWPGQTSPLKHWV